MDDAGLMDGGVPLDAVRMVWMLLVIVEDVPLRVWLKSLPVLRLPLLASAAGACRRLILSDLLGTNASNPTALVVNYFGRFGNAFRQVMTALQYARILSVWLICVPAGCLFLNSSFTTTTGVQVLVGEILENVVMIRPHFFYTDKRHDACFCEDELFLASTFRAHVVERFPMSLANQSRLYEHIRSGDVFYRRRVNPKYGQPPCSYYINAARLDGSAYSDVQIISENTQNPCVSVLTWRGAKHKEHDFADDLGAMLWASRLVLARSSLGTAVLHLSLIAKTYDTFAHPFNLSYGHHMDCEPTKEYDTMMLGMAWRNKPYQRRLMVTSQACEQWRDITHNLSVLMP
jgi:hypothetical protein